MCSLPLAKNAMHLPTSNWRAGASQPSRSFERILRRTSCKCACAAFYALLFIRNYFLIFTHFHRRCLAIWADRSSQRENSPHAVLLTCSPFCRCTIRMQRRQVHLSCFTKGKLCAADGTLCSPNIAAKSQLGRSRSPTMF